MYPPDFILALPSCQALLPVGRLWPSDYDDDDDEDDDDLCGDGGDAYLRLHFDGGVLWFLVEREGVEEGVVQVGGQHKTTVDMDLDMDNNEHDLDDRLSCHDKNTPHTLQNGHDLDNFDFCFDIKLS